jgi:geranylgeranyl diphosphate synthase type II
MFDFKKVLESKKELVWLEIKKYLQLPLNFAGQRKISDRYKSLIRFHEKIVSEYPKRQGKYIRPSFVLLICEAMGGNPQKAIKTAAAMQVSEDWILNHDDIEDESLHRRGKPTLHEIYGVPLAINAGDGLQTVMWRILWDNAEILGLDKSLKIVGEFYEMITRTIFGLTVEMKWRKENRMDLSEEDCFFIIDGKTVYYSIAGPMRLGAIIADAKNEQLESLYEFAKPLGRCFQIKDDILDLTSDFAGLKKQQGNDIYEGKRTLMLTHLLNNIEGNEEKKLYRILKKNRQEKKPNEVEWVIKMMKKYGSIEYGKDKAKELANEARDIFEKRLDFLEKEPARSQLKSGIDFILERNH